MQKKYSEPLNKQQINGLMAMYSLPTVIAPDTAPWTSQYDSISARVNYSMVRLHQPTKVVEFGTRGGRCTHDILHGLLDNGLDFVFKPYEILDDMRALAQKNIDDAFDKKSVKIGGDIMEAKDLPDDIDYLFVDNSHDYNTTKWVFEYLLPEKCVDNCLVHFHDLVIYGDYQFQVEETEPQKNEIAYFMELIKDKKLPLKKIFWGWETGIPMMSSTWWYYEKN